MPLNVKDASEGLAKTIISIHLHVQLAWHQQALQQAPSGLEQWLSFDS